MATAKTILKKTHQEAVVKVAGAAAGETISLSADLLPTGQVLDGSTQTVNIVGVQWTGAIGGIVTISRNSVIIMTLQADAAGVLEFGGQAMIPDTIENTQDILVTMSGAQAECWLKLRKVGGYKTTIEPEQYGSYDNPAVAGS
jgi:hypothetical protein